MDFTVKMESLLIAITTVLCATLVLNLLYKLRLALPWRVNCWFCNSNFWVQFVVRNSWVCQKCEQYNGFTKDGDYNKPLNSVLNESAMKSPRSSKIFQRTPPKNGLCKMCNVNQQLKVVQLANFVPMNEKTFDSEIENYKLQLEQAYKLCSPCRKVLQKKLHTEKEVLLGSKILETRSPEKKNHEKQNTLLKSFVNTSSMLIAGLLVVIVSIECYQTTTTNDIPVTIINLKDILLGLLDRLISIMKMKIILTFPSLGNYSFDINKYFEMLQTKLDVVDISIDHASDMIQKALGGLVCLIQIIGHIWNINKLKYTIFIDLLWSVFVVMSIANTAVNMEPIYIRLIKLTSVLAVLLVYKNMDSKKTKHIPAKFKQSPSNFKNTRNGNLTSFFDDDSDNPLETDDDVSLSKFGLHNFTDSSNETISPLSASMLNGRSFTPRKGDSIWTKPKQFNSTFCVNTALSKSPSSISESVFVKPSFSKFQHLTKDDSDSDLDESISTLCISSPKKASQKNTSVFSLRKFNATPSFVAPAPMNRSRPLISPSKLGHSTSWVAGGYWGTEGERQIFTVNGSRSSSQSSGFESQASSANQRTAASQPPSREESVCGDNAAFLDRFQNCGTSSYSSYQPPQNFNRVSSPIFPQMHYNSHVHIPQPRLAPQPASYSAFPQQQYQNNPFKSPGGTGLIRLPQQSSFRSH